MKEPKKDLLHTFTQSNFVTHTHKQKKDTLTHLEFFKGDTYRTKSVLSSTPTAIPRKTHTNTLLGFRIEIVHSHR